MKCSQKSRMVDYRLILYIILYRIQGGFEFSGVFFCVS